MRFLLKTQGISVFCQGKEEKSLFICIYITTLGYIELQGDILPLWQSIWNQQFFSLHYIPDLSKIFSKTINPSHLYKQNTILGLRLYLLLTTSNTGILLIMAVEIASCFNMLYSEFLVLHPYFTTSFYFQPAKTVWNIRILIQS